MKKSLYIAAATVTMLLASCETKTCVCYEQVSGRWVKSETVANSDERCANLSTNIRRCVESYDEDIDPEQIAVDNKR